MPMPVDIEKFGNLQQPAISETPELIDALTKKKRRVTEIVVDDDLREVLNRRILQDFYDARNDNHTFRINHVEYMNAWRGTPEPIQNGPIGDLSANVKVPLTQTFVEQWKARLIKILLAEDQILDGSVGSFMSAFPAGFQVFHYF